MTYVKTSKAQRRRKIVVQFIYKDIPITNLAFNCIAPRQEFSKKLSKPVHLASNKLTKRTPPPTDLQPRRHKMGLLIRKLSHDILTRRLDVRTSTFGGGTCSSSRGGASGIW